VSSDLPEESSPGNRDASRNGATGPESPTDEFDTWYSPSPSSVSQTGDAEPLLALDGIRVVDSMHEPDAEGMLLLRSWAPITDVTARIWGIPEVAPTASKRYAVRALVISGRGAGGTWSVSQSDAGDVFVHWACMGHGPIRMQRQPILLTLPREPRSVFVTVTMVE
jgi:hypothetical protein